MSPTVIMVFPNMRNAILWEETRVNEATWARSGLRNTLRSPDGWYFAPHLTKQYLQTGKTRINYHLLSAEVGDILHQLPLTRRSLLRQLCPFGLLAGIELVLSVAEDLTLPDHDTPQYGETRRARGRMRPRRETRLEVAPAMSRPRVELGVRRAPGRSRDVVAAQKKDGPLTL